MERIAQILETYAWYQSIGNQVSETPLARYVHNREHPDIWVANHLSRVRAHSPGEIDQVLRRMDEVLAHCAHRMVMVDSLTPDPFVARLALDGYSELTPTLQMVLAGKLSLPAKPTAGDAAEIRPVTTDADWESLYPLVRANHIEGSSSHHLDLDDEITRGIVAGYRAKSAVSQFFLARCDGTVCAYGSAILGPHGMGIVEDLFTLQSQRRRGLATRLIVHAVSYARERGMGPMLIGPHVTEAPKALYAALGFVPQCVTRQYIRALS